MPTTAVDIANENAKQISALTKSLGEVVEVMKKTPAHGGSSERQAFGVPWARTGEDPLTSRGFSFIKMLGLITQVVNKDEAKVELDLHDRMTRCFEQNGYNYGGAGITGVNRFMAPLATDFFHDKVIDSKFRKEMKSLVRAGCDAADPAEMNWIRTKQLNSMGITGNKALSWLNELSGGALVAPPEMGELIELLRNKEALVNAGARTVPLPPQGRMKFPRQTSPSTTYWVGESSPITASDLGTGEVTLQAKKLAVLIKAPNELIRFASPAAEALMRDDMTKSLALGLDLAGLEGLGGDNRPRGLINMPFINNVASSQQTANGDLIVPNDIYRMIAAVEESNAEWEGWVMRPKTLYKYYQLRSDAVAQGDKQGLFMFGLTRDLGDGVQATIGGYPVTKSTQVSQSRSKGTANNLTYIVGGMWSDLLIGMFGAIEFAATTMGDTSFTNDQTWVRGILSADIAARHESAFALMDSLSTTL